MPTYEYECPDCKHRFEEFQSITAKPIKKCPKCAKRKVRRLIGTGAGVIFKGSGFYETDYVKKSKSPEGKAETTDKSEPKSDGSKKSEPKQESKPKKESKPARKD